MKAEMEAQVEAKKANEALEKQVESKEAKQDYEKCLSNCDIEKTEAESGIVEEVECCGDWFRYLCFCYAGTCCASAE